MIDPIETRRKWGKNRHLDRHPSTKQIWSVRHVTVNVHRQYPEEADPNHERMLGQLARVSSRSPQNPIEPLESFSDSSRASLRCVGCYHRPVRVVSVGIHRYAKLDWSILGDVLAFVELFQRWISLRRQDWAFPGHLGILRSRHTFESVFVGWFQLDVQSRPIQFSSWRTSRTTDAWHLFSRVPHAWRRRSVSFDQQPFDCHRRYISSRPDDAVRRCSPAEETDWRHVPRVIDDRQEDFPGIHAASLRCLDVWHRYEQFPLGRESLRLNREPGFDQDYLRGVEHSIAEIHPPDSRLSLWLREMPSSDRLRNREWRMRAKHHAIHTPQPWNSIDRFYLLFPSFDMLLTDLHWVFTWQVGNKSKRASDISCSYLRPFLASKTWNSGIM